MELSVAPTTVSAWIAVMAGAGGVALGMFAKASKTMLDARKNIGEVDLIRRLEARLIVSEQERKSAIDDAREAWKTRTSDAQSIARLMERELALQAQVTRIQDEFDSFKRFIYKRYPEAQEFFPSGFMPMERRTSSDGD